MARPDNFTQMPAQVRYDKRLQSGAKILYSEIKALTNTKGYCWASNSYLAENFGVSIRTIQRWLARLKSLGYIYVVEDEQQGITFRRIYMVNILPEEKKASEEIIAEEIVNTNDEVVSQMSPPHDTCVTENGQNQDQSVTQINKYINNININKRACARITQPKPKSKNNFHNFSQRDYDYDLLEKILLSRGS